MGETPKCSVINIYCIFIMEYYTMIKELTKKWDTTVLILEWLMSKTLTTINISKDVYQEGTLINCWWECKMTQSLWKTVWQFLAKQS